MPFAKCSIKTNPLRFSIPPLNRHGVRVGCAEERAAPHTNTAEHSLQLTRSELTFEASACREHRTI